MRDFERAGARLRTQSLDARIAYSVFLLFTFAAFGVTLVLAADLVGWGAERTADYYAGRVTQPAPGASAARSPNAGSDSLAPTGDGVGVRGALEGPTLEIPDEALAPPRPEPMPLRKLLEVSHFHLFSIPVYLLILSHLFMLSSVPAAPRRAVIVIAAVTSALHVAAPWIARADWPGSRAIFGVSGGAMTLAYLVMMAVPLIDMWRPKKG